MKNNTKVLSKQVGLVQGKNLQEIAIRIGSKDRLIVQLGHDRLHGHKLLVTEVGCIAKVELVGEVALRGHGLANLLIDADAVLLETRLGGLQIGDDDADVVQGADALRRAGDVVALGAEVDELEVSTVVVLVAEDLLGGLVGRAVATALAVAHVGEADVGGQVVGEDVSHAEDLGVELDALGDVVDVKREVVHEVAGGFGIGGGI